MLLDVETAPRDLEEVTLLPLFDCTPEGLIRRQLQAREGEIRIGTSVVSPTEPFLDRLAFVRVAIHLFIV